ncbi:MAG: naringenin-chalcone synthase [Aphanocapsa sp. GSE-SYN-MK-11-07L]|jgi:alpha-pyrone synthase|nr:naringenin-chalcone synthase [Aphanocapsa sp. GSE-SYN-MK-11-07L]
MESFPFVQPTPARLRRLLPTIESIATGTPNNIVRQSEAAQFVASLPHLHQNRARIERLYSNTRIDTRHLAVDLFLEETIAFSSQPSTIQTRMQMFQEHAVPLAERVAKQAIATASVEMPNLKDAIRLVVFVTSTGFFAPGVDTEIIRRLALRRDTARVTVNFMGCAAAMNGLRIASDHVRANPTHKALVVCLELSSVNAVFADDLNDVIIHSIFGDGCAAVVIGACEAEAIGQGKVIIRDHLSQLVENSEDGISLDVQDNGITCKLSRQLPDYIEAGVGPIIESFLASHDLTKERIDLWAVHPGGVKIIEKVQAALDLTDAQVADSWEILRQYGNMLSASVLFVLERMLLRSENHPPHSQAGPSNPHQPLTGIAFSFSPGVGIEGLLFQKV